MGDENVYIVLGATSLAALVGVPLGSARLADSWAKKADQDYQCFESEKSRLKQLRYELGSESWRWPIYVRPVLFTEIDQIAQYHFSNAEHALLDAEELRQEVLAPPKLPSDRIGRIASSWSRLGAYQRIRQQVSEFSALLDDARQEIEALRKEHEKESNIQSEVKLAVENLELMVGEGRLDPKNVSRGSEYENLLNWASNAVQNCLYLAKEKAQNPVEDGINYAIADILVKLGRYVLTDWDLYEHHFQVPSRFELDHFNKRLAQLGETLTQIIGAASIQNWHELYLTACMLELANIKLQQVNRSLNDFIEKQEKFLGLEHNLGKIDFAKILQESDILQTECTKYWRTRDEDANTWAEVIGTNPLPSKQIEDARRFTQSQIAPLITGGVIIKQSNLSLVIQNIDKVLNNISLAQKNVTSLADKLLYHKKAEKDVWARISPQGDVYKAVKELQPIELDSSPEIIQDCAVCRQTLDTYVNRATMVRGANFPGLRKDIEILAANCAATQAKHQIVIRGLASLSVKYVQRLAVLQEDIKRLQAEKPGIEWDWETTSGNIRTIIQSYALTPQSFSQLNTYLARAKEISENAAKDKSHIQQMRRAFTSRYNATGKRLTEMLDVLKEYDSYLGSIWGWARNTFDKNLQPIRRDYLALQRKWQQVLNLETVQQAIMICEHIESEITSSLTAVNKNLEEIRRKQDEYSETHLYLLDRSQPSGIFNVSPKHASLIQTLCSLATRAEKERDVKILLSSAEDLIKRSISKEEIIHIEKLVQDFSSRIDIGQLNNYGQANFATNINQPVSNTTVHPESNNNI